MEPQNPEQITATPEPATPAPPPLQASDLPPPLPTPADDKPEPTPDPQGADSAPDAEPPEPTPDAAAVDESDEDFEALLDQYDHLSEFDSGDLVQGTIVTISDDSVLVDLGDKTEGVVPIEEFKGQDGELTNQVGDRVDILVLRRDGETGQMIASRRRAIVQAALALLEAAFAGDDPLTAKITRVVKNGVIVDLGLECYMPGSHIDIRRVGDLKAWVGREIEVLVLELQRGRKRAVVSRRAWLERLQREMREKFFVSANVGDTVTGHVKNITEFGVFVDLGGFDGLVPRDELSWERGMSPGDVCAPGDEITAKIINMNERSGKITLSRRRSIDDPWITASEKFKIGDTVPGVVVNLTAYGAFVRIAEGLTGLIHASDMSWGSGRKRPEDFVKAGDQIKAQILELDPEKKRLSLGLKQITPDPWAAFEADFPVGTHVKGKVTSVTSFGLFVEVAPEIEGLIHQSDLSWERRGVDPTAHAAVGDEIEAVVLKVDRVNRKISLSHKHLSKSPYLEFAKRHPVGSKVKGKVTRTVSFGAIVDLGDGIEGLIHISHLDNSRVEKVEDVLKVGDDVDAKILKLDAQREKINLSRRALLRDVERAQIAQYAHRKTHGGANLGEALQMAGIAVTAEKPEAKRPEQKKPKAKKAKKTEDAKAEDSPAKAEEPAAQATESGEAKTEKPEPKKPKAKKAKAKKTEEAKADDNAAKAEHAKSEEPGNDAAKTPEPAAEVSPQASPEEAKAES
jgi:small subunit ribosomal protein S1